MRHDGLAFTSTFAIDAMSQTKLRRQQEHIYANI
jgi:hypothetical protein